MYNKVIVVANLCKDPELRYTPQGTAVVNLRLAINRKYKSKGSDELKEEVCFITAVAWGKQAETCNQYLHKGSKILLEGRLQSRNWEKDGVKQYAIEIFTEQVKFLDSRKEEKLAQQESTEQTWLDEGQQE